MISKNESFKPPKDYEEWANREFSNILDYLSEKHVNFDGTIFLKWLAAPYISIWNTPSTKNQGFKIWVMHNLEFTDYIISNNINNPRDAIIEFGKKWNQDEHNSEALETLRVRNGNRAKLLNYSTMLSSVGNDKDLWSED